MNGLAYAPAGKQPISDASFLGFQRLVLELTGIALTEKKRSMIVNRFSRRLVALNISDFDTYLKLVSTPGNPEITNFIDTITTNHTYFFREPHHFDFLGETALPDLIARKNDSDPIRMWSAGCSSGQEPYSIGITVLNSEAVYGSRVKILCTDIHSTLVATTLHGLYDDEELRGLSQENLHKWFSQKSSGKWQASMALRNLLYCKQLNLFSPWPIRAGVDVIMCRNVMIYFDLAYQRKLLNGFAAMQQPGAYLFLGHSENIESASGLYKRVENTVYQRL